MSELKHLLEAVRPVALGPDEGRIAHLRIDRWIDYPRAAAALETLEDLLSTPGRARMPCLLLHGASGMGKTMLVDKFVRAHKPRYDPRQGIEKRPIIAMQMPTTPSERRFYVKLLETLEAPCRPGERLTVLEHTALRLLRQLQPQVLVVDEVHHLLAGSGREQRAALNLLKFLSNELQCCVVAVGTRDALVAMQTDAQIASRFQPFELPRWRESEELRRFLAAFERVLPLREPSQLVEREMTQALLEASDGITGNIARLLTDAARRAIRLGEERITLERLKSVIGAARGSVAA